MKGYPEEQVKKQIQETLARLSGGKKKNQSAKQRRTKRDEHARRAAEQEAQAELEKSILRVTEFVAASELASLMDVSVNDIISACMSLGHFVSINQRLDAEIIQMVAEEFGFEVEFASAEDTTTVVEEEDMPEPPKSKSKKNKKGKTAEKTPKSKPPSSKKKDKSRSKNSKKSDAADNDEHDVDKNVTSQVVDPADFITPKKKTKKEKKEQSGE